MFSLLARDQQNFLKMTIRFQITPDNIVNLMLTTCDNWNVVYVFARGVLRQQRLAERASVAGPEV